MIQKPEVIKDFIHNGRRCVVVKIDRSKDYTPEQLKSLGHALIDSVKPFCNGYIEADEDFDEETTPIGDQEVTYTGDLNHIDCKDGKHYIGFDTNHYYNWENPKTRTAKFVEAECKRIAELISHKS